MESVVAVCCSNRMHIIVKKHADRYMSMFNSAGVV
jgi:hypothetical protein